MAAEILQLANQFRAALLLKERQAASRLIETYGRIWSKLYRQLAVINQQIEDARRRGEIVNQAWLFRQERYGALLRQVDREFQRFADVTTTSITRQQASATQAALSDSVELMNAAAEEAGVTATFNRLPNVAVENLVGFLSNGSPLRSLIDRLPAHARRVVEDGLIQSVALGISPRETARRIREGLGGNLTRALSIARTETMRAYRTASSQTYKLNSDIVEGWYWRSARGALSCAACVALDGTFHSVNEPMKSHVRCRCVQIPAVEGVQVDRGVDWFERQPAQVQREILNTNLGYDAVKSGELKLADFVGLKRDPQWGDSYYQLSVRRARAGEGKFPVQTPAPPQPPPVPPPAQPPAAKVKAPPKPKVEPGPEIRAKLLAITKETEDQIAAIKKQRDVVFDKWLNATTRREQGKFEREMRKLDVQAVKLTDKGKANMLKAVYQPRRGKFSVTNIASDPILKREIDAGVEAFARMVGSQPKLGAIDIRQHALDRSHYDPNRISISMHKTATAKTVAHELAHWLEDVDANIHQEILSFYSRRTAGDLPESLHAIDPRYDPSERTKRDQWLDPYIGKIYLNLGDRYATEILSMGLEMIYHDPWDVATRDPEFFDFIMSVVRRKGK